MSTRDTTNSSTTPKPNGPDFLDEYAGHVGALYDASCLPLSSVGGTGDVVTASVDPVLPGTGLADGMKFTITWGAANTGGVTLNIDATGAVAVVEADGSALVADALAAGQRDLLEYVGGSFRRLSGASNSGSSYGWWEYTATDTWTKPAGLDDDRTVLVRLWGGGGGGASMSNGAGGGGGGFAEAYFRAGDLPSSVTVTIGAGGAVNNSGSDTTFGTLLTAFAGRGAGWDHGGGGAGSNAQGGYGGEYGPGSGGFLGGGDGGDAATDTDAGDASSIVGGGGGGYGKAANAGDGGRAVYGGGGGGGHASVGSDGSGGASLFGGDGGDAGNAGAPKGGGGGRNAAGGRGHAEIILL